MVEATRSNQQTNVVHACVDRDVNLLSDLIVFIVFTAGYLRIVIDLWELDAERQVLLFQHYKLSTKHDVLLTLLRDLCLIGIGPPIYPLPAVLRLPRNVDVFLVGGGLVPVHFGDEALRA